jgi:ankyrin repeat protein
MSSFNENTYSEGWFKNVNLNKKNKKGFTALHKAASGNLNAVKYLVESGASLESTTSTGLTPLHIAAKNGQFEIVKYLVENGAQIDPKDNYNVTPLHFAVVHEHLDIIKYLIFLGANVNTSDVNLVSPLASACSVYNLVIAELLVENGAIVDSIDISGNTILARFIDSSYIKVIKFLLDHGADVEAELKIYSSKLLTWASIRKMDDVTSVLLQYGADYNSIGSDGKTVLEREREKNNEKVLNIIKNRGKSIKRAI